MTKIHVALMGRRLAAGGAVMLTAPAALAFEAVGQTTHSATPWLWGAAGVTLGVTLGDRKSVV